MSAPAWLAIIATLLVMIGTYFCPDATVYDWWSKSALGAAAKNALGPALSCYIFGILYVLPAALLISTALHKKLSQPAPGQAVLAAVIFVAMLFPAIYIQCANLATGMMLIWLAGSLLGALTAFIGAFALFPQIESRVLIKRTAPTCRR